MALFIFQTMDISSYQQCMYILAHPLSSTWPSQILSASSKVSGKSRAAPMDLEPTILAVPSSDADSLVSVNDPDTMTNEPMWPTDEEMHGADADQLSVEASIGVF